VTRGPAGREIMAKLDEYRVELVPTGEWGATFAPDQRVRVYDSLSALLSAMGSGIPKDYPRAIMIRIELYDANFTEWPPYEGRPVGNEHQG
jgi:hypothetical protein